MFLELIFGSKSKRLEVPVVRKVKRSDKPALTNAKHGSVLLKGKIKEYEIAKAK